jgi:hypothetical protein
MGISRDQTPCSLKSTAANQSNAALKHEIVALEASLPSYLVQKKFCFVWHWIYQDGMEHWV